MTTVEYLSDHYAVEARISDCRPYGQSPSGYGRKIATPYMVRLDGRGPWRRVYAVCFSNAASHYVVVGGKSFYVRHELDSVR